MKYCSYGKYKAIYIRNIYKAIASTFEDKIIKLQVNNIGQLLIKTYFLNHYANNMKIIPFVSIYGTMIMRIYDLTSY